MIATKESGQGAATPLAALLRSGELGAPFYFLAFNLANVFNYLFLIAMAKGLSAEAYGLFGALFGIVYLTSALGNSVQVTLAKFTAELSSLGEKSRLGALLSTATARILVLSLVVALVFLAGAPLLAAFLHTSSPIPILLTGSLVFLALSVPATWPNDPFRSSPMVRILSPIMPPGRTKRSQAPVSSAPSMMPRPPWSR